MNNCLEKFYDFTRYVKLADLVEKILPSLQQNIPRYSSVVNFDASIINGLAKISKDVRKSEKLFDKFMENAWGVFAA